MKTYQKYIDIIKKIQFKKSELKNSDFYKYIENNYKDYKILLSYITSMCIEKNPSQLRIRNDSFLKNISNNLPTILLSGIKYNEHSFILCFFSKSFDKYPYNNDSSNSFINFSYEELIKKIISFESDNIAIKNKSKYIFYVVNSKKFNKESFNLFFKQINNLNLNSYYSIKNTLNKFIPPIPNKNKFEVRNLYNNLCAITLDNLEVRCPCGKNIEINYLKQNKINYTDIHHFAPKEFLIQHLNKNEDFIDWNLIHDSINLIPLCSPCHQSIHKGSNNKNLVRKMFDSIIECYKEKNTLEKFKNYLNSINLDLNKLLNFYLEETNYNEDNDGE